MKRLIAVLTAGAMGAAVLTGCGGGQTAETAGESTCGGDGSRSGNDGSGQ
mgnify:CR=1 FL=1